VRKCQLYSYEGRKTSETNYYELASVEMKATEKMGAVRLHFSRGKFCRGTGVLVKQGYLQL
jgi:hypothetical protein